MKKILYTILVTVVFGACQNNTPAVEQKAEVDVLLYMNKLQLYANKAYFAAKENNKALHGFYVHEMEETMEDFSSKNVLLDGKNLSENMEGFGLSAVKAYEAAIEKVGLTSVDSVYAILSNGCNSCHMVSEKPYLIIKEPTLPAFTNQDYTKNEYSDITVDGD